MGTKRISAYGHGRTGALGQAHTGARAASAGTRGARAETRERGEETVPILSRLATSRRPVHSSASLDASRLSRLRALRVGVAAPKGRPPCASLGYITQAVRLDLEAEIRSVAAPLMGLIRRRESNSR